MKFAKLCAVVVVALVVLLPAQVVLAGPAATDTNYFDGFVDLTGIDPFQSTDVELDALGGVRLKGNGVSAPGVWTAAPDFRGWVSYEPQILIDNPFVPLSTLSGAAVADSLTLPATPLAFRRAQADPVLTPPDPLSVDGYGVGGMSVVRVNLDYTYYMYYTGYPENESTGRIYLAKSNTGTTWTRVATPVLDLGEPGSFDSRQLGKPSVLYDAAAPAGTPKFKMWYTAEGDLYGSIGYATSDDGVAWAKWIAPITVVDPTGDVGTHASMALGADGLPVVAYYDATNGDLKFVHCGNASCSEGNTILALDTEGDVGQYASLAIGVGGLPTIAYYDATNANLKLLHCGTPACTLGNQTVTLDGASPEIDAGAFASLAIGSAGFPVIAYHDATNGDLKVAACNDVACAGADETLSSVDGTLGANVGAHASIGLVVVDPLNTAATTYPAISYYDATAGDLKLAVCNDAACAGADETIATLDGLSDTGLHTSLVVGPSGFPTIAYYDAAAGDLRLIACNDTFCAGGDDLPSTVDGAVDDVGQFASLAFAADGLPVIGYYDVTNGDLLAVHCNDAACADEDELPEIVDGGDPAVDVGQFASLLIGSGGAPLIAYYDVDNADLKVAPTDRQPQEVLGPGLIGSIDSYTVGQPCVLFEGGTYRMWYTANDSNNRRIAYASSSDGITWARGGLMVNLNNTANDSFGAWSPTVWKEGTTYQMIYTGWKPISGSKVVQSKLITADSPDGTTWTTGNVALNPGNNSDFDGYNLFLGHVLVDTAAPTYKLWYAGNNPDSNGNYHDRIGYATKAGTGGNWGKVAGPAELGAVLGLGAQSPDFDSMFAADLAPIPDPAGGGALFGFYTGTNAVDFMPRIGVKRSEDGGATWFEVLAVGTPLVDTGAGAFDAGGVARPAPVDLEGSWAVYHTSLSAAGAPSIGLHTVSSDWATVTSKGQLIAGGSDPWALRAGDAAIVVFYAQEVGGLWTLNRVSYNPADQVTQTLAPAALAFTRDPATCWDLDANATCDPLLEDRNGDGFCTEADCDPYDGGGMRQPVVLADEAGLWRLWYTAIGLDGAERVAYAESTDAGLTWTRMGLAVDRSTTPYDFAEKGIRPAGVLAGTEYTLTVTGTDRFGWRRSGLLAATAAGVIDAGAATYQYPSEAVLADPAYLPRDWRQIVWNPPAVPAGTGLDVWVSYFPTASDMWSNFFKIDNNRDLPFLLSVKGMRWQVRLAGSAAEPAVTPQLDDVTVDNADIAFPASGLAVTIPVGPPSGRYLLSWGMLTVSSEANGGTLSLEVRDQDGVPLLTGQSIGTDPWTYDLTAVPATSGRLLMAFTLTPNTTPTPPTSPLLKSVNVTYESTDVPSSITLVATPSSVYPGQTTSVAGWLESRETLPDGSVAVTALTNQLVTLKMKLSSSPDWTDLGTVTTDAVDGSFDFTGGPFTLTDDTQFRAEWPGLVDVFGDGTIYPPAVGSILVELGDPPLSLTLQANPSANIVYGASISLSGSLSSELGTILPGQKVTIKQRAAGATEFTDFPTPLVRPVNAAGTFTTAGVLTIKPLVTTEYQVTWGGGDALGTGIIFPPSSTIVRVGVRPRMSIAVGGYASRSGSWFVYRSGSTCRVYGKVIPKHYLLSDGVTRGTVTIKVYKSTLVDGVATWVPFTEMVRTLGASKNTSPYSWSWRVLTRGNFRVQTTFSGDGNHDPAVTSFKNVKVN